VNVAPGFESLRTPAVREEHRTRMFESAEKKYMDESERKFPGSCEHGDGFSGSVKKAGNFLIS
jgi:hypothetical protein